MSKTFEITSGRMVAIDPCYSDAESLAANLTNVRNGTWVATPHLSDEGSWGTRVKLVVVRHVDIIDIRYDEWETFERDCGVDSGQFGFWDGAQWDDKGRGQGEYGDPDGFYGQCCNTTQEEREGGITTIVPGFVSSSGFGDGGYPVEVVKRDGEIVAARVTFIGDDDDDEVCAHCGAEL